MNKMGKKELIINGHFERRKKNLEGDFKYVYICSKCKLPYGSDKKEKQSLCPICIEK